VHKTSNIVDSIYTNYVCKESWIPWNERNNFPLISFPFSASTTTYFGFSNEKKKSVDYRRIRRTKEKGATRRFMLIKLIWYTRTRLSLLTRVYIPEKWECSKENKVERRERTDERRGKERETVSVTINWYGVSYLYGRHSHSFIHFPFSHPFRI